MEGLRLLLEELDRPLARVQVKVPLSVLPHDGLQRAKRLADLTAAIISCLKGTSPNVNFTVSNSTVRVFVGELMRVQVATVVIGRKFAHLTITL